MVRSFIAGILATLMLFAGQAVADTCKYSAVNISGAGSINVTCDASKTNYATLYGSSANNCTYFGSTHTPAVRIDGSDGLVSAWCSGTASGFGFTALTGQSLNTLVTSNAITVAGFGSPVALSVANGEYQIDSGAWSTTAGTVSDGQTVRVRHTTAAAFATTVTTTLTISTVSGTFNSTTQAQDTTPDPFSFTALTTQALGTSVNSGIVTVAGINAPANITITGGEYQIGDGAWSSAASTISNGQTVRVRHTTSAAYETSVTSTLTIGGISGNFSSTTLEAPGNACKYSGITISGDGNISVTCDPSKDNTATLYGTSAYSCTYLGSSHAPAINIDGSSKAVKAWCASTASGFGFTALTGQVPGTLVTSNAITVSGFSAAVALSVTSGEYQIDSGAWSTAAGTISDGQTVRVRHTTSAAFNTPVTTTLTIGGVSGVFTSTTLTSDTTPDPFSFTALTSQTPGTLVTSNTVTVSGINMPATISITAGEYQIGEGAWSSAAGTISNDQTVRVRHTTSAAFSTVVTSTLTIGGVSGIFSSTTQAQDTTPDPFSFTPQNGVARSTEIASEAITISGINVPTPISVSGGSYSVNNGAFTNAAGSVSNGQSVRARLTSSSTFSGTTTAIVTIGGGSGNFTVTTNDGNSPLPFAFTPVRNATLSTLYESNTVTLSGLSGTLPVTVTGGEMSINGGAYSSATGSVREGSTIRVRQQSSAQKAHKTRVTVTVGATSGVFDVTTKGGLSGGVLLLLD